MSRQSAGVIISQDVINGTAVTGAVTVTGNAGKVTSEALTTAAGAVYTLTITNKNIAADSIVFANVALGTATTGQPSVLTITPAAGSVVIVVKNIDAAAALNGTIIVRYLVIRNG